MTDCERRVEELEALAWRLASGLQRKPFRCTERQAVLLDELYRSHGRDGVDNFEPEVEEEP